MKKNAVETYRVFINNGEYDECYSRVSTFEQAQQKVEELKKHPGVTHVYAVNAEHTKVIDWKIGGTK